MGIKTEKLTKLYADQKAIDAISLHIETGEIVGFLGPNGAGKSTTMKILTGFLKPTSGTAFINGKSVLEHQLEIQRFIGYLPEHNPLYLEMYVREYLLFCAGIHKITKDRIEEVIKQTGLTGEVTKKIAQLSKGYRQRVGLAAALLHDPDVLILDEPTTGLDPNQLVEIRQLIKEVGKTKTVLLSTHIMQEVEAVCNRVIIINKGKLVADKKLKELQNQNEQIIQVEFDKKVEEPLLNTLPDLIQLQQLSTSLFLYELRFDTPEDRRSVIFDWAKEKNLKILQLKRQSKKLEDLFREATHNQ